MAKNSPVSLPKRHRVIVHSELGTDADLSKAGRRQCRQLLKDIEEKSLFDITHIISSPLNRGVQTSVRLFKKTPEAQIVLWPELASSRDNGVNIARLERKYTASLDLLDLSRLSRGRNGRGVRNGARAVKNWLLEQQTLGEHSPLEVAVVTHSSVMAELITDFETEPKGLPWVTCVFNDNNDLVEMGKQEFNQLKRRFTPRPEGSRKIWNLRHRDIQINTVHSGISPRNARTMPVSPRSAGMVTSSPPNSPTNSESDESQEGDESSDESQEGDESSEECQYDYDADISD